MQRFHQKTAIVTGAGSGLGRDISIALGREGARQVILMDIDRDGLNETARHIADQARPVVCDVADPTSIAAAWDPLDLSDGLDVLITAAGTIGRGTDIEHCSIDEWDHIFAVNVRGTFLCVQRALPHLRKNNGCIVTLGSTAGLAGSHALGAYSASKGAVSMMTRSLALSQANANIRVNCVCPGSIRTPMLQATFDAAGDADASRQREDSYRQRYPLGRFGEASEVTSAVLFLASADASYMTGVCLPVDGGVLA